MNDYKIMDGFFQQCPRLDPDETKSTSTWMGYFHLRKKIYNQLSPKEVANNLISEINWITRSQAGYSQDFYSTLQPGTIVYMDFGQAYRFEAGYQHFGILVNLVHAKALVVPMTSNPSQVEQAYDAVSNPFGKRHLMRIGMIGRLNRPSVLFLNDMKFVNTSRVIGIYGQMDVNGPEFHELQSRLKEMIEPNRIQEWC